MTCRALEKDGHSMQKQRNEINWAEYPFNTDKRNIFSYSCSSVQLRAQNFTIEYLPQT